MIEAALQVADEVVIGIGTPNRGKALGRGWGQPKKTWVENPLPAIQRQMILQKELEKRGLADRVKFMYLNDIGNSKEWGKMVLEQMSQFGVPDIVARREKEVNAVFPNTGIKAFDFPKPFREQYQGKNIRKELRVSGALVPYNINLGARVVR